MPDVSRRIARSLLGLALAGCNTTSGDGLACGPVHCPAAVGAYCAVCPTGGAPTFACGIEPPVDRQSDSWQHSAVCPGGARGDVPFYRCDGPDDCSGDTWCVATLQPGTLPFAVCRPPGDVSRWCERPTTAIICQSLADCPGCATGCEPVEADVRSATGLPLRRCYRAASE